jgi:beta-phosphoglucomutase
LTQLNIIIWLGKKLLNNSVLNLRPEHNEELKGVSRVRSLDIILALGNIEASQEDKDKWLVQKNEDYLSYLVNMDESEILPGVLPVLIYLKENNQKIVLGSASKNANQF